MARVSLLSGRRAGPLGRLIQSIARRRVGRDFVPLQVVSHAPPMLLPYTRMAAFTQGRSALSPQVRALARHVASEINGCAWCRDYGEHLAAGLGIPAEKLARIHAYATDPAFTPAERAALAFAEQMTQVGGRVDDATFAEAAAPLFRARGGGAGAGRGRGELLQPHERRAGRGGAGLLLAARRGASPAGRVTHARRKDERATARCRRPLGVSVGAVLSSTGWRLRRGR